MPLRWPFGAALPAAFWVLAAPFARAARAGRLPVGHQLVFAGADQIGAAHGFQRLAQHRPVFGVVIAQERLVQPALAQALDRLDRSDAPRRTGFSGLKPE